MFIHYDKGASEWVLVELQGELAIKDGSVAGLHLGTLEVDAKVGPPGTVCCSVFLFNSHLRFSPLF